VGRRVFALVAGRAGVDSTSFVPLPMLAGVVIGVLLLANLAAIGPALASGRAQPMLLLRRS
jgi:uncharacterized membrane protein